MYSILAFSFFIIVLFFEALPLDKMELGWVYLGCLLELGVLHLTVKDMMVRVLGLELDGGATVFLKPRCRNGGAACQWVTIECFMMVI